MQFPLHHTSNLACQQQCGVQLALQIFFPKSGNQETDSLSIINPLRTMQQTP